jgi:parallel beta-helix repeat protein
MSHRVALLGTICLTLSSCGGEGGGSSDNITDASPDNICPAKSDIIANTVLDGSCTYTNAFVIRRNNVTLDCNGATIDGLGQVATGISVDSAGAPLSNVTVQNCTLVNHTVAGIHVGWDTPDSLKIPLYTHAQIYARTPQYVTIENTRVSNSQGNGIYLGDYVTHATLDGVTVENSARVGLYMDSATTQNTVKNSTFRNNGSGDNREGIAIDASAQNTITGNVFQGNALAGITLYKNCWEHHSTDPNSFPRWQHSNQNLINNNQFLDEGIGIWIASRQSRNLSGFDCGDPSYYEGIYFLDYAQNNTVSGNVFSNVATGVIVEDNDNRILNNDFSGVTGAGIEIGAQYRALYLNEPVTGTVNQGNIGNVGL